MSEISTAALRIDSEKTWEFMCALDPHFKELSYEDNQGYFLVFNLDADTRWAILSPATLHQYFDHTEQAPSIKTYNLIRK